MKGANNEAVYRSESSETFLPTLVIWTLLAAAFGCDGEKSGEESEAGLDADASVADAGTNDRSIALFQKEHLVEVQVEMAAEDWATLKKEARSAPDAWSSTLTDCEPQTFEYTYFKARVTVDGETTENAGIRKKGYLGSLSAVRPSLKINFGKFEDEQRSFGMKRMTLNNDRQDASHTHQCMTYDLFRQAGLVAPRCNFAKVTVNGEELGIYTHVESIKKPFLARHFASDEGNLYEGAVSDFQEAYLDKFEVKTNEDENDKSDLKALVAALQVSDDILYEELDKLVDLDAFFSFWALEVLTGHWDGMTGDNNNFYMYNDPATNKFYFIPWGTDGAFADNHQFIPNELVPASVYAYNTLAYRLYGNLTTRKLYHERLRKLLSELWDVQSLLQEVDSIEALTSGNATVLEITREFIRTRGENIMSELVGDGPDWLVPPLGERSECRRPTEVSGTFEGTWRGNLNTPELFADVSLNITLSDPPFEPTSGYFMLTGTSDPEETNLSLDTKMIGIFGMEQDSSRGVVLWIEPSQYHAGEIPLHGFETAGWAMAITGNPDDDSEILGVLGDGTITLVEAGSESGDPVSGTFSAMFFESR